MLGRRQVSLDTSLLGRVSDASEVSLGAYPEAVLAVTGADRLGSVSRHPSSPSSFARLDDQARDTAMQAALDRLIADGTVAVPAGTTVRTAVAAATAGKLPVSGALGELCRLTLGLRRFRSAIVAELKAPQGDAAADMPPGVPPPGVEFGYCVPFSAAKEIILLVERPDFAAGNRSFTLRTLQAEINRIADFLFCDPAAGAVAGQSLHAEVRMVFRSKGGFATVDHNLARSQGEDHAVAAMIVGGVTIFNKLEDEQTDSRLPRTGLVNAMVTQFVTATARISSQAPPRWSAV